ncbi:hypothetical protein MRB53_023806 [Persea americana]|uniref:Uncharacterized protein n=1 Tax=Persea americana TaxID=3435 RepID=A0ACC2LBE9_PERAE|nr:hypothetical protein MRB53_023806 [Persea americana]|eukprot:TRINITY_DN23129_c0_g1_i2.p1 TRINITY_DN23129_c0_g1~~TRINITY_DN23129_c0_g1_i2.p1  ORF type:complete len:351 (-),score=47.73 TRINITY_DN23129_c0_g1_i2:158-1210(-)
MGNCIARPRKSTAEISPSDLIGDPPVVRLYGPPSSPSTWRIRIALLYKSVAVQFVPSENPSLGSDTVVLQCGSDTVSGRFETLLQYIEGRFPKPALVSGFGVSDRGPAPAVVVTVTLQHRSMMWHLDRMVKWAEDLEARQSTRGARRAVDPCVGSPRMEVKKFGRSYSQLLEMMLEHAQMEERIVFPVLERADRGLSKGANEEHARDLPIMNGIKEDIKSIGVLDAGSLDYQEAMSNLSSRLNILLEHCKEHFEEEEQELLPLLEAAELSKEKQEGVLAQCMEVMGATHSHLFHFLMAGLIPQDAMQYLDMVTRCNDSPRLATMLRELTARMEGSSSPSMWDPLKSEKLI